MSRLSSRLNQSPLGPQPHTPPYGHGQIQWWQRAGREVGRLPSVSGPGSVACPWGQTQAFQLHRWCPAPTGPLTRHPPNILMDLVVNVAAVPMAPGLLLLAPWTTGSPQAAAALGDHWIRHCKRTHLSIHCGIEAVISNLNITHPCWKEKEQN